MPVSGITKIKFRVDFSSHRCVKENQLVTPFTSRRSRLTTSLYDLLFLPGAILQ